MLVHRGFAGKVLTNKNKFKFLRTKELNCLRFEHLLEFLPFFAFFLWFSLLKLPNLFAIAFLNPLRSSIVDKILTFSLKKSVTQSTAPKFSYRLNHNALKCLYNIFIWTPLSCYKCKLHNDCAEIFVTRGLSPLPICVLNSEHRYILESFLEKH